MARKDQRIFRNKRFSRYRGSALWPVLMAVLSLCGLFLAYRLVFHVIVPFAGDLFKDDREVVLPTATPQMMGDLSDRIQEVLLTSPFKHISYPVILGNDIFFASGSDNAQNPKLDQIFLSKTQTSNSVTPKAIEGIEAQCGYILHLDVNASYIVFFDGYRTGGGLLKVYERDTQLVRTLCSVDYGVVCPKLSGTKCIFLQRTSLEQEKLYCMDVETLEVTTLHVYDDSPLGKCEIGVSDSDIVFVAENPDLTDSEKYNTIYIQSLNGTMRTFDPGLYAYSPVINGNAIAFSDRLDGGGALYLSVDGAMQKKIAQNVYSYGLAQRFLAWCEQGRVYVYYWADDKTYMVSKPEEYAMLTTVSDHAVAWFDITAEKRERDILKFAVLD